MKLMKFLIVCLFICQYAWAEIYKYTDKNGKIHFTDTPPMEVKSEVLEVEQPIHHGTPPPNKKAAKALFEQDKIKQEQLRRERILAAKQREKEKATKQIACEKAKSDLVRMKQYRAQASSTNSKRYYNKRVDMAKEVEDEACKLSNFR